MNRLPSPMDDASLSSWLDWLVKQHGQQICLGLERLQAVMARLPQEQRPRQVITIAGTNGKGTLCHLLNVALRAHGVRAGCYTSPVLRDFRDRLTIDGSPLPEQDWCQALARIHEAAGDVALTFFEYITLAAWLLLQAQNCDVWILEIGLGGRLDAVNSIDPDVSLVTHIDLDHQARLGHDRATIAREKLGIARPNRPLIVNEDDWGDGLLEVVADAQADPIYRYGYDYRILRQDDTWHIRTPGQHWVLPVMEHWMPVAVAGACMALQQLNLNVVWQLDRLQKAWQSPLEGRCQRLFKHCPVWLDVAHNPNACKRLAQLLSQESVKGKTHAIFACRQDKAVQAMWQPLWPLIDHIHLPEVSDAIDMMPSHDRACLLHHQASEIPMVSYGDYRQAWYDVRSITGPQDRIVIFGSFYLVGPIIRLLEEHDTETFEV